MNLPKRKIYHSINWHMSPAMNEVYHLMETYLKKKKHTRVEHCRDAKQQL
jgi:hypothetical protein